MKMSFKEQRRLYEMVEKSIEKETPIIFPMGLHPVLQVDTTPTGPIFKIPNLMWRDEKRNLYCARMEMRYPSRNMNLCGLYVVGAVSLDGSINEDTSVFRKENRYFTIF